VWFYPIAGFLVVVGIVGGIFTGGIFTIVFVPLGVVAALSGMAYGAYGRAAQRRAENPGQPAETTERALPHTRQHASGHVPTSPESLADARRRAQ
jgi:hypothetical protein